MLIKVFTYRGDAFSILHFQLLERLFATCVIKVSRFNPASVFYGEILATTQTAISLLLFLFSIFLYLFIATFRTFF